MLKRSSMASAVLSLLLLGSCSQTTPLDDARLRSSDQDASNWLMYGRTYDDHRFSPLKQINEETVGKLGLAWSRELGTTRGLEATPLGRRHHLRHRFVERGVRHRREDR